MPQEALEVYRPARTERSDFDRFWKNTLAETKSHPLNPRFEAVDFGLRTVETFDVTFAGYGGQDVKGWLLLPRQRAGPLPCLVEYIGYGGGRSFPFDWLVWSSAGYAHLVMDTRGQGSSTRHGDTPDIAAGGPHVPGFMTQGILNPETYYYRRVYMDGVRAVEMARTYDAIDPERVGVTGRSQGGGITIAVAGLQPDVSLAMPDVPFLCHFRRATELVDRLPYQEISRFCMSHRDQVDQVFHTLSYFDGMNLAARAQADALFSVGLMDMTCPPSTVYAAYNHYGGTKNIKVYRYNDHEGGGSHHVRRNLQFLREEWGE
jgi:cephalosporin-C deacetylase